jgi:helicase SWR1
MPSKDIDVSGLEVGRTRASMARSKRGSGKLVFDLNNTDGNAPSRYKRPIPETNGVITEQMMDAERAKLLGEKQAQLVKVTKRHDTLVCLNFLFLLFFYQFSCI